MKLKDIKKMKPLELAKWYNKVTKTELIALLATKLKNNMPKVYKLRKESKDNLLDMLLSDKDMKYRYNESDIDRAHTKGMIEATKADEEWKSLFGNMTNNRDYRGLYKQLAKYLHPDNRETGNEDLFKAISILK